jgi:feruloyl-CoA synthase
MSETAAMDAAAPFREAEFMAVNLVVDRRVDGSIVIRSAVELGDYEANLPAAFAASSARAGDKTALAFRGADGAWVTTSYAALKRDIDAATQWLLDHVPRGRAIVVIAGNTLPAAALTFAAYAAGVIHCPVGLAYGMAGGDRARLRHVIAKTNPALIYTDANPILAASVIAVGGDIPVVTPDVSLFDGLATAWADVVATTVTSVAAAIAAVDPYAVASYMLTSGSTGLPKVVPTTQDNIAACTQQGLLAIGKAAGWGGTMLDWLPWHHAAGASVLRATLLEGGSLYVDAGKPAPGLFDATIANLREIPVAYFNNVPLGYAMLVEAMETDAVLRHQFFSKLRLMLYGGAGLAQHVHDRLQAMAVAETGHRIHMTTGYGMTETVTGCMVIHFPTDKVGIGLPTAGLDVKLVPYDARFEVRLRGPNVMRGYLDDPAKTAAAFDDEGFYRTGDLAVFHDPAVPEAGLAFAGRLAEEFKLSNGTWVYGGQLRDGLLKALAGFVGEVVLADDGRDYLTVLAWGTPAATLDAVVERLRAFNAGQRGGSATVHRVMLLDTPPAVDANEISDKGTINRRAVLDNRRAAVAALYAEPPGPGVGVVSGGTR